MLLGHGARRRDRPGRQRFAVGRDRRGEVHAATTPKGQDSSAVRTRDLNNFLFEGRARDGPLRRCSCNRDRLLEVERRASSFGDEALEAPGGGTRHRFGRDGDHDRHGTGVSRRDPCSAPANEIVAENCLPGTPSAIWNIPGAGSARSRATRPTSASTRARGSLQGRLGRLDLPDRHLPAGLLRRQRRAQGRQFSLRRSRRASRLLPPRRRRAGRCSNWSVSASWDVPPTPSPASTSPTSSRETARRREPHPLRRARRRRPLRPALPDLRHHVAGVQRVRRQQPLHGRPRRRPAGARLQGLLRPPVHHARRPEEDFLFNAEYPMVRWLERNGYDVSYLSGVDSDARGDELLEHRAFLSVGHDEYWSGQQRANVEAARNAGVDLAFFSGNEVFWKTRWEDGHRTLVSYKETHANTQHRPDRPWTGTWRDPRFNPRRRPARERADRPAVHGQLRHEHDRGPRRRREDADLARHRSRPRSRGGTRLPDGTLGYEWDEDIDNGARPPGLVALSTTDAERRELQDEGSTLRARHRDPPPDALPRHERSGDALVFGAGTVQWSWGLDAIHDRGPPADSTMQQATVNLFADMGAQRGDAPDRPRPADPQQRRRRRADRARSPSRPAPGPPQGPRPTPAAAGSAPSRSRPTAAAPGTPRTVARAGATRGRPADRPARRRPRRRRQRQPRPGPQSHATARLRGGGGPLRGGGTPGGGPPGGGPSGSGSGKPRPQAARAHPRRDACASRATAWSRCASVPGRCRRACTVRLRLQLQGPHPRRDGASSSALARPRARPPLREPLRAAQARAKGALRVTAVASVPDGPAAAP